MHESTLLASTRQSPPPTKSTRPGYHPDSTPRRRRRNHLGLTPSEFLVNKAIRRIIAACDGCCGWDARKIAAECGIGLSRYYEIKAVLDGRRLVVFTPQGFTRGPDGRIYKEPTLLSLPSVSLPSSTASTPPPYSGFPERVASSINPHTKASTSTPTPAVAGLGDQEPVSEKPVPKPSYQRQCHDWRKAQDHPPELREVLTAIWAANHDGRLAAVIEEKRKLEETVGLQGYEIGRLGAIIRGSEHRAHRPSDKQFVHDASRDAAAAAERKREADRARVEFFNANAERYEAHGGAVALAVAAQLRGYDPSISSLSLEQLDRALQGQEDRMVESLQAEAGEFEMASLRCEADRELAPHRDKMRPEQVDKVRLQLVQKRLLEAHQLPRLSLFYMPGGAR